MGLVLPFGVPMVRTKRRASDHRPCEITIFPGVRYERRDASRDVLPHTDPKRHLARLEPETG